MRWVIGNRTSQVVLNTLLHLCTCIFRCTFTHCEGTRACYVPVIYSQSDSRSLSSTFAFYLTHSFRQTHSDETRTHQCSWFSCSWYSFLCCLPAFPVLESQVGCHPLPVFTQVLESSVLHSCMGSPLSAAICSACSLKLEARTVQLRRPQGKKNDAYFLLLRLF